jgi:sulfoxide reductase heme-binding subunit YedZ
MQAVNRFIQGHMVVLKIIVFGLCLLPFAWAVIAAFEVGGQSLGANPIEELIHHLGNWGLKFLLITLSVTPLRQLSGVLALTRFRRMLGLFAFFYVSMHFLSYAWVDHRWDGAQIIEDIIERPFITIGITALLCLIPLALTSTRSMQRRLGRNWQKLHRLVYPIAGLGVWHFWWQVKKDITEPAIFAGILVVLLGWRIWRGRTDRSNRTLAD